ncbi:SPOSA6832_02526 [Sporobolomyces salmonicolor]|uniref:SPOSA6832_02526-mRNA-1:cds n=1 Tax=Sporidiobolus salmonicolor TaxID=5005 RepID=A0A0D6ELT4_SPOSA|nr:SPOSA6832_02526 [Sporobolomyces salmonicolor]
MASIEFCNECSNLLYPKEDKVHKILLYACRNCGHQQETLNACVYKHDLIVTDKETAGVTQDLDTDPTLVSSRCFPGATSRTRRKAHHSVGSSGQPRSNIECPRWSVFFGDQAKRTTTSMTLFYNCTACVRPPPAQEAL